MYYIQITKTKQCYDSDLSDDLNDEAKYFSNPTTVENVQLEIDGNLHIFRCKQ